MASTSSPQVGVFLCGMTEPSLYRPYEKLVVIRVLGKHFRVPENNTILRCLQYLSPDTIPYGRFCWNQECQTCRVSYRLRGQAEISVALSCKVLVVPGMEITELSPELMWNLGSALNLRRSR